jgi:4-amino-4-deoxy-L-arabinose transferase-like glycosyltransferase
LTDAAAADLTRAGARPRAEFLGIPWPAWLIALAVVVMLLLVSGGYGFHRDEMYFLLAGRHPAFGDVDQPPLTPLLTAAAAGLLGVSPTAVRIAPAIAAGIVVLLAAGMSRELGRSRRAQILAALVLAISGWLGAGHLDETVTFDVLFWSIATWLLAPLVVEPAARGSPSRWVAVGVVIGIALENKTLAVSLVASVGTALLLLVWLPNLVWQAANGFPQVAMAQAIAADQGPGLDGRLKAVGQLLAIAGPLLWPVAIAGVVWLLRGAESRAWRPLGLAIVLQGLLMLVVNGKSYYAAGFLPLAIAAGSIPLDRWLSRGHVAVRRGIFALACVASAALVVVLTLPSSRSKPSRARRSRRSTKSPSRRSAGRSWLGRSKPWSPPSRPPSGRPP